MRGVAAQRGEAHLWLLLEEALVAIARGGVDPWEVQRHFRYVTDAVALAGIVPPEVTRALRLEFDDALVVRRLVPPASFVGAEPLLPGVASEPACDSASVPVWLEAEIERHLDLLGAHDPALEPGSGAETMRILAGPVRAFEAAGVLGPGKAMIADLAASIAAAGFDADRVPVGDGRVRREWVRFLRDRPSPLPDHFEPSTSVTPRTVIGRIGERNVRIDEVAWSADALELKVALRAVEGIGGLDRTTWHARVLDHRGRLHLGQPVTPIVDGGGAAIFRLRPGLEAGVSNLAVRVTARGFRVEGPVSW